MQQSQFGDTGHGVSSAAQSECKISYESDIQLHSPASRQRLLTPLQTISALMAVSY